MKKMSGNPACLSCSVLPGRPSWLKIFFELTKIHLSLYIALSAVFGHVLAQNRFTMASLIVGGLVMILAAGSAIMNHIQDRDFDLWFSRTRYRCLVQKRITPLKAGFLAMAFIFIGLGGLLVCFTGLVPAGLGLFAVICYNGLYTPLKKRSLGAIVPGALCGMLPPAIGWVSVPKGMAVADMTGIVIVMLIFGMWQIPHFFIVLLKQDPGELAASPYPSFFSIFSRKEIKTQILLWSSLYSLGMLLFLLRGFIHSLGLLFALGAAALILPLLLAVTLGQKHSSHSLSLCFFAMNLSMLFFMGLSILDRI